MIEEKGTEIILMMEDIIRELKPEIKIHAFMLVELALKQQNMILSKNLKN